MSLGAHNISYELLHYDVCFKSGSPMNDASVLELCGLLQANLDWVFIVELGRRATPEEIHKLCKLIHER